MIIAQDAPTREFGNTLRYSLLDTYTVTNETANRLAVLRRVQFRNTKDGKPFVRLSFEDINGLIVIGRLFDCSAKPSFGTTLMQMVGGLVLVEYTTDYFNGELYLNVVDLKCISDTEAANYTDFFSGKYTLIEPTLRSCNALLSYLSMSEELATFKRTFCNLEVLAAVGHESISKGLRGYILNILEKTLIVTQGTVSSEAVIAFVLAILTWFYTRKESDTYSDDSDMMFVASMMDYKLEAESQGLTKLSAKISEFAALFNSKAAIISSDSYLLFNLFQVQCEASNIAVLESRLPDGGFCTYGKYKIRRS